MKRLFDELMLLVCKLSLRHPFKIILVTLILSWPLFNHLGDLTLDTDLVRLLPKDNPVVELKDQLEKIIPSSGGYFTILLESHDKQRLMKAFWQTIKSLEKMETIGSLQYTNNKKFYDKFRYLLIPSKDLDQILEFLIRKEAQLSPAGADLLMEDEAVQEDTDSAGEDEIKDLIKYIELPKFHQSEDGHIMGIKAFPKKGITRLGETRKIYLQLKDLSAKIGLSFNIWMDVGGSLRNDLDQYEFTLSDLSRSGIITLILILLALMLGFRHPGSIIILLLPILIGIIWTLGFIPLIVGSLNTITSFLLLISLGLGIDFTIHLVKRYHYQIKKDEPLPALVNTFQFTGKSIIISGLTTALALCILAFSNFRGFSEFGLISCLSILLILLATILVLPSLLVIGTRLQMIKPHQPFSWKFKPPSKALTTAIVVIILAALILCSFGLNFNYDFSKMEAKIPQAQELKIRYYQVYKSSRSAAALFVVKGENQLDHFLDKLEARINDKTTRISRYSSIRDFTPHFKEYSNRLNLIGEIKDIVSARWVNKVKKPEYKKFIKDITWWKSPVSPHGIEDIPSALKENLISPTQPDQFIVLLYIKGEKQKGRNAMAFTEELSKIEMEGNLLGPYGDTPILADILKIVTSEGPWLVVLTFVGIFILILVSQHSILDTLWIMIPLLSGILLTAGVMVVIDLKINFFNIVAFPTLLGIGIDDGVHLFHRWQENNHNADLTQKEMLIPLSLTTITTIAAYLGIAFSRHPGLQSIGILACLGLISTWFTSVILLPGLLKHFHRDSVRL